MKDVKLKKEEQKKLKSLSKGIYVLSRIGRIALIICVPFYIIGILAIGYFINIVEIKNDEIAFKGTNESIKLVEKDGKYSILLGESEFEELTQNQYNIAKNTLENTSPTKILVYGGISATLILGVLIIAIIVLRNVEKLFININKEDTPFILDNVDYLKKLGLLMIISTVFNFIASILLQIVIDTDISISAELFSIVEILMVYCMAYIFEYGYELQQGSKSKIYIEE